MLIIGILLLYFASAINTLPIHRDNEVVLAEGDIVREASFTPLESEMLERKKRCNDCDAIGFIFITSSTQPVNVSDLNSPTKFHSKEIPTSNDPTIKNFLSFTSENFSDSSADEALKREQGFSNKDGTNCCQNGKMLRSKRSPEKGLIKKHSSQLVSKDQGSVKDNEPEHNCTFFSNVKNITMFEFPGEPFAIICIDDYDKLGFCGPIEEIMFDCRAIPTKEAKYSCCIEKFIYKFLSSFNAIYDSVTKLRPEIISPTQEQVYIPLYPIINTSSEN